MKKRMLALLLCMPLLFLCGCTDGLDLSLMVISMGIDITSNGVIVTIKAPDYSASADKGGQESDQEYLTLSASGVDWAHALATLSGSTPRALRYSQLREAVISLDSLSLVSLRDILSQIGQLQNVRTQAVLVLCREQAKDFLTQQQPYIGKRLSKYLDVTLENYTWQGYIPATTFAAAYRDLGGAWRQPLVTYASLNLYDRLDAPQEGQPLDVQSGDLPRQGASTAEYIGAVAMGDREYAILTAYEMQLYHLITGGAQTLYFEYDGRYYSVATQRRRKLHIKETDGHSVLTLELPVVIEYSIFSGEAQAGVTAFLEGEVSALLHKLQAVGCDALGFGSVAVRRFASMYDWNAYAWGERYRQADIVVQVKTLMRQAGRL